MKHMKPGVILLVLLLAAMAMVPPISAAECQNAESSVAGSGEFTSAGDPVNLFDEFGLSRPDANAAQVPFRSYNESRDVADKMLAVLGMTGRSGSVIGVYDLGARKVMLMSQEDSVLEAVYDGNVMKTYSISPEKLGEKRKTGTSQNIEAGSRAGRGITITTETITGLYSLTLQFPGEDIVLTSYLVKKSRTDVYRTALADIASLHTEGWFYVNYGSSITSIGDYSTYWVTSAPFWQACEYSTQNLGVGTTAGQHKTHLKFGAPYVRHTMDMWVSCDAWLNANDGGFTNSWSTGNNDACS